MTVSVVAVVTDVSLPRSLKSEAHRTDAMKERGHRALGLSTERHLAHVAGPVTERRGRTTDRERPRG
jgi:hypothetical protein